MLHNKVLESYLKHLTLRDGMAPPSTLDIAHVCMQLQNDIEMYKKIWDTHYINPYCPLNLHQSLVMHCFVTLWTVRLRTINYNR